MTLLIVELIARDVSLTLVAAPLAAMPTICANLVGFAPGVEPAGARGAWLFAHIALSFVGHRGVRHRGGGGLHVPRASGASSSRGGSARSIASSRRWRRSIA